MKQWFINDKNEIRFVHTLLRENIEYDFKTCNLVVSIKNNLNGICKSNCIIEEVETKNFYNTQRDCQIEILIRERFKGGKP